jgi:Skp family chaperone for outer membrane proteins
MGLALIVFPFLMPDLLLQAISWFLFAAYCATGYLLIKTSLKELQVKETLETEVKKRTEQLQKAYDDMKGQKEEIEKWYKLTIGRELRMAELKKEINELKEVENKN